MTSKNKLVAIVNKDIEIGVAMNAIAHASLACGAILQDEVSLQNYADASGNTWQISERPYIILRGKSGEIRKAILQAKEAGVMHIAFTETMTDGTSSEQIVKTSKVKEEEHVYYCGVLFGDWDTVSQITKRLSLYK